MLCLAYYFFTFIIFSTTRPTTHGNPYLHDRRANRGCPPHIQQQTNLVPGVKICIFIYRWYQYVANRRCSGTSYIYPILSYIHGAVLSYWVPGTWYLVLRASQWRPVQSPPRPTNSKRFWTRAEVDEGHNKGPPQTSQGANSMLFRWSSRDQRRCTHQHTDTQGGKGKRIR